MIDSSVKHTHTHFPTPKSWSSVSLVHPKSFIVLPFTFRVLICLESILHVHYLGESQFHFFFFFLVAQFSQGYLLRRPSFFASFHWFVMLPLSFIISISRSHFCPLCCSSSLLHHRTISVPIFLPKVNSLEFFSYFVWDSWGLFITKYILSERCKIFSSSLLLFLEWEDFSTYIGESISKKEAENTEEGS